MSLHGAETRPERSACSASLPSASSRTILRSFIDTTSIRPSGSHPIPDGRRSTTQTSSTVPARSTVRTCRDPMSENHSRPSRHRGPSTNPNPPASIVRSTAGTIRLMARTDLDLITYASGRLIGRLEGLDDDEYLWELVPHCCSVRPADGGGWHADLGPRGATDTPRTPAPFTTIAWRLWHLGASPRPTWPPTGDLRGREFVLAYFGHPPSSHPRRGS